MCIPASSLTPADQGFLLQLQRQALEYFLSNQTANGLMLDRQSNHGPLHCHGLCSTTATGMGFLALGLASAPPHRLCSPASASQRIRTGLETVLERLPHDEGIVPHFVDSRTFEARGNDHLSTIETAWLAAGGLWAAAFLKDVQLETLARQLYDRVDWHYWTASQEPATKGLLRHGKDRVGRFLPWCWDRVNGETAFLYVLAAGAAEGRAVPGNSWMALQPFYGTVAGRRFNNADLGLFVFQYGLDLLDLKAWEAPGEVDLVTEAQTATLANHQVCQELACRFATYRRYWGLSAGDGPGDSPGQDTYRCYAPTGPIDGTAHLTATLASVVHAPPVVLENLYQAQHDNQISARGRFGFSNVNVDRGWVSRDMVGIDVGAAVLGLDNYLMADRVRNVFQSIPCVRRGLERLGFTYRSSPPPSENAFSQPALVRQAS
jgi:hypothetical protein